MKSLIIRFWNWIINLFRKQEEPQSTVQHFQMKANIPEKIERAITGQSSKREHPLHGSHFGTFSPLKPIR